MGSWVFFTETSFEGDEMSVYDLSLIATVVMALAALASAAAAALSARTAKKALSAQTEPKVIMFMDSGPGSGTAAQLYIRNIGSAPAYDVTVSISPEFPMRNRDNAFLDGTIAFIQPGGERRTFVDVFYRQIEVMGDTVYEATVRYGSEPNGKGRAFVEKYPIEGKSFAWNCSDDVAVVKCLEDIQKSIDEMSKRVKPTK